MRAVLFSQGAKFSRTGIFWTFVQCGFCHVRYGIPHPWHRSEPREELHIPYTLLPALPRSSDVLTLNPAGKVPILKAAGIVASLVYVLYLFLCSSGKWKHTMFEFFGFEDCCQHHYSDLQALVSLLFTFYHIGHLYIFFI